MKTALLFVLLFSFSARMPVDPEPEAMKGMLARHNEWRAKVGVPPLQWSNELAQVAQEWALELARRGCEMEHRPDGGKWGTQYGENLYWSMGIRNEPGRVVDAWGDEVAFYDPKTGKCKGGVCGHYTQVVWKNTTHVGCGMARCGNQEIWVCNYNPAGNWVGEKPY